MPRFFFHVRDGKSIFDHEGVVLPDIAAARLHAVSIAGRILADEPERIECVEYWSIAVADETGAFLLRLDVRVNAPLVESADETST